MIIKNQPTRKFAGNILFLYVTGAALIGFVLMVGFSYVRTLSPEAAGKTFPAIHCDMETIDTIGQDVYFTAGEHRFTNGATYSDEKARSGKHSSKLDRDHQYGAGYSWDQPVPGDRYRVSIWRYGYQGDGGTLIIHGNGNRELYLKEHIPIRSDENGWDLLERVFQVPAEYEGTISVYVMGSRGNPVYFDDLSIEKIYDTEGTPLVADSQVTVLDLKIEPKSWDKLRQKRESARREGFLITAEDDWVKGEILEPTGAIPIKLRLKGDLVDHIARDKWSFRISVKAPYNWQQMTTFSVHTPAARGHLMEWVYHRLLEKEGILTPRYSFIMLRVNGKNLGVYACEEHFVKQLAESQSRREGPIIRMEEEGVWLARKQGAEFEEAWGQRELAMKSYEASRIQPFDEKRTVKDTVLSQQFAIAQNLLYQHKFNLRPVGELFDLDRLAKYYALTDLAQAYHGIIWHNERFYYNPVLSRLEPIGFDGYTHMGIFPYTNKAFLGSEISATDDNLMGDRVNALFLDPAFAERYYFFLYQFCSRDYIDAFMMELDADLLKQEKLLRREFDTYTYDRTALPRRAEALRHLLTPVNDATIVAYAQRTQSGNQRLRIANFHLTPLQIKGWGATDQGPDQALDQPVFVPCYEKGKVPVYIEAEVPIRAKYLYYGLPGVADSYFSRLLPWQAPEARSPAQDLFRDLKLADNDAYRIEENRILFLPDEHRISSDIVIPAGYLVRMGPGTRLNFVKGAKFISRSPVQLLGEADHPVEIFSEDKTGQGFSVLQAAAPSEMRYAIFSDLNTLRDNGWILTGAVTFYESDVTIDNCVFQQAHCEDGLNLVRSTFTLRNSLVKDTYSDGFDADFCTGEVSNTRFMHTGNDGMDFSGSAIRIVDCEIIDAGDKGISVGEAASVRATGIRITGAVTGVASKDLSELIIGRIDLKDCVTGFAAYQKKPEFGGATISVDQYTAEGVEHLHLIENDSKLSFGGKAVEGI